MSNATPPPPPMYPPQPPPPRRGPSNAVVIGSAAAVIAAVVATGIVVVNSGDDDKKPEKTSGAAVSAPADDVVADEEEPPEEPAAEPEDAEGEVAGLNDTVEYGNDVQLSLSKFTRGTSGPYGAPENTPYVKFGVRVKNNGKSTVDTSMFTTSCSYGKAGKSSESVYDSDQGLNGGPDTKLLAGRSITVTWACEMPKAEKTIQIEVSPDMDMEAEAAIFTGDVK
ncbi:DUF4352 domain-containing protein [Streptomyces venezuelae]|uniref:DUF4352 domain-containing protein n=1 Tax=Streptomyces venezuelae TaxID=54571 RepID=A0A5P2C1D0_STRVZ|nr:DUF4352 domain-containing protein [Streptomyces venezuelae]QES36267.1 hypothetical protein DEJ48_25225 [Streptomyces venezuelae]